MTIFFMITRLLSANLMSSKRSGYILFSQSITLPFIVGVLVIKRMGISRFHIIPTQCIITSETPIEKEWVWKCA